MFSKEHTQSGRSEYQEAIIKKFDAEEISVILVELPHAFVTTIAKAEIPYALTLIHPGTDIDTEQDFCDLMNEFLGKAHIFFFGTDVDESVEPE